MQPPLVFRPRKQFELNFRANLDISKVTTARTMATVFYLEDLQQAQAFVYAIVVGRPLIPFAQREHYAAYSAISVSESLIDDAWSIGSFKIDRVLYENGGTTLLAGQIIPVSEPVALITEETTQGTKVIRFGIENIVELKQNSQYVLFLNKQIFRNYNPVYATCNLELGRFNTDGTDLDDEVDGRQRKELLRGQLTAAYGVAFAVPTHVAPTVSSLVPSGATSGGVAFTLTVNGTDFKNGATIKLGSSVKTTTFLSATKLSAPIAASDIASAASLPVIVTNPDNQVSAVKTFAVQASLPTIAQNRDLWNARAISSYGYTLKMDGYVGPGARGPVRIEVRNGVTVSVEPVTPGAFIKSVRVYKL